MPERREIPVDPQGRERRVVAVADLEIRAADTDGYPIGFKGHAAVFDKRTAIGNPKSWGFWEQVARGAFAKTIKESDVRFLHNHNPDLVLARNTAGNLTLSEDKVGLLADANMTPTSYARDLALSLERKDVSQMSFGFRVVKDQWETLDDDTELRTLMEVQLFDVSTVTYPAYDDTDAALRAAGIADVVALAEHLGMAAADRERLAKGIRARHVDPDLQPILASVEELLRSITQEPAETTPEPSEPAETTRPFALVARRHQLTANQYALEGVK